MKKCIIKGFSFGLTSGIITTLGLMVGLYSSTKSEMVVISGIIVIALSDAMSDALGVHISEEAENVHTHKEVWVSTIATFLSKFCFAMMFIIPVMIFSLKAAIIGSVLWGLLLISVFSYYMALNQKSSILKTIFEHLFIAILVIIATHYIGEFVSYFF